MRLTIALASLLVFALACSESGNTVPDSEAASLQEPEPLTFEELIRGPVSDDGLQAIFATPDLGVGRHRVAFALQSQTSLIDAPSATVQSFYEPEPEELGEPVETSFALFRPFPIVERGLYSTHLTFDRSGEWAIQATVLGADGNPKRARLYFDVPESSKAPALGEAAIKSVNRTADDVEQLSQLTTGSLKDPDLYQLTIADAVESGRPTVIVMASPAFCTNAVCGPQVDVLRDLKNEYADSANFIHIDLYDNPDKIQGDLGQAVISPVVREWSLPSTEWSFVIDRDGKVSGRFEGFCTLEELREALVSVL